MVDDERACTQRYYEVTHADLPLSCPMVDRRLWDAHPRVYLPIETTGKELCPYCGTLYMLKDFNPENAAKD
jgi:uncharacterized Zn-finger protein